MDRKWKNFGNILEMTTDEKASLYKQYRREFTEEYSDQYYELETKIKDIYKSIEKGEAIQESDRQKVDGWGKYKRERFEFFHILSKLENEEVWVYDENDNLVKCFNTRKDCAKWIFEDIDNKHFKKGLYLVEAFYEDYLDVETEEEYLYYLDYKILEYINRENGTVSFGIKYIFDGKDGYQVDRSNEVKYRFCDCDYTIGYKKRFREYLDNKNNDELPF